jgi:delta endotoxin, N-terminal domain
MVPYGGAVLGALADVLWPTAKENLWDQIKKKVEQLIDQKLDEEVYSMMRATLKGLRNIIVDYETSLPTKDHPFISARWNAVHEFFEHDRDLFQRKPYQLLLLPLFAQYANLHLGLLRDGVLFGRDWEWKPETLDLIKETLKKRIEDYREYAETTYYQGFLKAKQKPRDDHRCEPFRTVTSYHRGMVLNVRDYAWRWDHFDPEKYPPPVKDTLIREFYSDPYGTCDNSGPVAIDFNTQPTKPINQITVWGWDRIDAIQVVYPDHGGPHGITSTGRMGNRSGGSSQPPYGGVFNLQETNPIVQVKAWSGDCLNAAEMIFQDGTRTKRLGGRVWGGQESSIDFSKGGERLSRLLINGVSAFYGSADCLVCGFQNIPPSSESKLEAVRRIYVCSAYDVSLHDMITQNAKLLAMTPEELKTAAASEEWEKQREKHWKRLEAEVAARESSSQ